MNRFAATVLLSALGPAALAQATSHAVAMREQIELVQRARECETPERICANMRHRASRATCYPPIVEWSSFRDGPQTVRARVLVAPTGKVASVELLVTSRFKSLDEAVVESMLLCRLPVVERNGAPAGSRLEIEWTLHEDETVMTVREFP